MLFYLRCPKSVLNACFRSPKRVHFYCGEYGRFEGTRINVLWGLFGDCWGGVLRPPHRLSPLLGVQGLAVASAELGCSTGAFRISSPFRPHRTPTPQILSRDSCLPLHCNLLKRCHLQAYLPTFSKPLPTLGGQGAPSPMLAAQLAQTSQPHHGLTA